MPITKALSITTEEGSKLRSTWPERALALMVSTYSVDESDNSRIRLSNVSLKEPLGAFFDHHFPVLGTAPGHRQEALSLRSSPPSHAPYRAAPRRAPWQSWPHRASSSSCLHRNQHDSRDRGSRAYSAITTLLLPDSGRFQWRDLIVALSALSSMIAKTFSKLRSIWSEERERLRLPD